MAGKNKEYEIAFKLGAELESSFRKSFGNAAENIEHIEKELRDLSKTGSFGKMSREAHDAEKAIRRLEGETTGFGATLKRVAEYTGAFTLIQGAADSFTEITGSIFSFEESMRQIQAATGSSAQDMKEIQEFSEELYKQGLGEDFNDLAAAITTAKQVTQEEGIALQNITKDAIVFRDVFGEDITQSIKASDTMMKNFGITSDQAFNLFAQGAQNGLNKSDELLDSANEYAPHFASLGFSANQMFDTFAAGLESGAFNLDKVGDAVKEFNIRSKDMSKTSIEAYEALGLSAEEMSRTFAEGGPAAQTAFRQIVKAISEVEDPVQKNMIGVGLFGTMFEDLEKDVVAAMGTARSQFDMTRDTMEEVANIKYDTTLREYQQLWREFISETVVPIGQDLLPLLQKLANWASENRGLIEFLALAVPGAMIGKNALNVAKGFFKVDDAATKAASGVSKATSSLGRFGSALGFFTNPVGIAVGAVGALTLGFMAYRQHQEAARQELLNMGDALEETFAGYDEIEKRNQKTKELTAEYDRLTRKIKDSKTPAEELVEARRKLQIVEEDLIELNPDILKAEDAKSEKFRQQLGYANELNEIQQEMSRRDLEKQVIDSQAALPDLENEYVNLNKNLEKYNAAYDEAKKSYTQYTDFINRRESILGNTDLSEIERDEQMNALADEIYRLTGKDFHNRLGLLDFDQADFRKDFDDYYDRIRKTEEEIGEAKSSFESLYETQKKLIEMDLGGPIEEYQRNIANLSEEQRKALQQALQDLYKLNSELDMLPMSKRIDIELVYKQIGNNSSAAGVMIAGKAMKQYADGGFSAEPAIFGEAGLEAAIPIDNRPRSHELLDQVNRMMGRESGGVFQITYAPQVSVPGASTEAVGQIKQSLRESRDEFERWFVELQRRERRLNLRG